MENFCHESLQCEFFDQQIDEIPIDKETIMTANDENIDASGKMTDVQDEVLKDAMCNNCGTALSMMKSSEDFLSRLQSLSTRSEDDDEYLTAIKKLQYASSEGLNIEYDAPAAGIVMTAGDLMRQSESH